LGRAAPKACAVNSTFPHDQHRINHAMSEQAFKTIAGPKAKYQAPEVGVGLLGYAFMGKAHSNAYKTIPYMMYPPPAVPRLVALCGRNEQAAADAASRYGFEGYTTDWRKLLHDPRVELFDNSGPNHIHAEPCIAAAQAGKHVLCEKPLARNGAEAKRMLDAVTQMGVKHMVAFNYRFVPAVRQAYDLIQSGALGRIYHFRALYARKGSCPTTTGRSTGVCKKRWPAAAHWGIWVHTSLTWGAFWSAR
jgi:predicted dehydrogenase